MADRQTLDIYDAKSADYAARAGTDEEHTSLTAFMASLPNGAHVLDLGCGPGHLAARMISHGFSVDPVDASAGMVAHAIKENSVPARMARFDDIDADAEYDGIWASFSLLHAPKSDFPEHLGRLHRALKPGGLMFLGMKLGEGEGRDALGRFYAYYSEGELTDHLQKAGFNVASQKTGAGTGLAGTLEPWSLITAHA